MKFAKRGTLPGFGLTLGYTVTYVCLLVLVPLSLLAFRASSISWDEFWLLISRERSLAAFRVTFTTSLLAAATDTVFGLLIAWVLTRYRFPGRAIADALVDLPFALPTAVAGIALTAIYAPNGVLGKYLVPLGLPVAFTPLGIYMALTFIGVPFVVRSVQPVLEELETDVEEAAALMGASRWQTFYRVLLPLLVPSLLTGFALAFARALGEYGSVVFISGNMPMKTEIVPLLIVTKLEQYDYVGATALATVMLVTSFLMLFLVNLLGRWSRRYAR